MSWECKTEEKKMKEGWKRGSTALTQDLPHLESSSGSLRKGLGIHNSKSIFQHNNELYHLAKECLI